jgi:hypothetical protein
MPRLGCRWFAPVELGRQYASTRLAHAHQLAGGTRPVDKHGDCLGHHPVEASCCEAEIADIAMLHSNLFTEARSLDVVGCALQHERGDIDCRDAGPEAARNPDRRSAHPTTHVEDALVGSKVGATNQFVRGRPGECLACPIRQRKRTDPVARPHPR